jgi:nitrate/TMAO reductase-like tetraheme cytochrome c subunit
MSSSEDSSECPNCHKFDNQVLAIEKEVRKSEREKVKKASMFL